METLAEKIKKLPPELQEKVENFVRSLVEKQEEKPRRKPNLKWRGALKHLRNKYTSVELQHKALEWWGD